jgi:hypothetical protein
MLNGKVDGLAGDVRAVGDAGIASVLVDMAIKTVPPNVVKLVDEVILSGDEGEMSKSGLFVFKMGPVPIL